jgi:hypothetical protein
MWAGALWIAGRSKENKVRKTRWDVSFGRIVSQLFDDLITTGRLGVSRAHNLLE